MPENSFFCGEIGQIYQQKGWLNRTYQANIFELVKQHETSFGLV